MARFLLCDTEQTSSCGGAGVCQPRGVTLLCNNLWIGVCGCDGNTYANTCLMHKSGVSAAHAGPCKAPPPKCQSNDDCDPLSFCATPEGECGGEGTCLARGVNRFCPQM